MSQNAGSEEDLTLTNPVKVWVQLQGVDLETSSYSLSGPSPVVEGTSRVEAEDGNSSALHLANSTSRVWALLQATAPWR